MPNAIDAIMESCKVSREPKTRRFDFMKELRKGLSGEVLIKVRSEERERVNWIEDGRS